MKLSAEELAHLAEQADRGGAGQSRTVQGAPGCRAQPLSYSALVTERRNRLNSRNG